MNKIEIGNFTLNQMKAYCNSCSSCDECDLQAICGTYPYNWESDNLKKKIIDIENYELLNTDVRCLNFSNYYVRICNCLYRANIRTVGSLIRRSKKQLLKVRNLGIKQVEEIIKTLGNMNLSLFEGEEKIYDGFDF